jgi:hypothetical protein
VSPALRVSARRREEVGMTIAHRFTGIAVLTTIVGFCSAVGRLWRITGR